MSVIHIDRNNFQREVLNSDRPVLLDFWAPWCAPCRMVGPILDEIAEERSDVKVAKINIDEQPELASQFGVMSIPTLMVMKEGRIVQQAMGARPKAQILSMLEGAPDMGLFDGWKMPDIGQGVEEFRATPGAVLLDVRSRQEFQEGHIPGSQNIPLSSLEEAAGLTENKETPLFVYCYSGARSGQAVHVLRRMGYVNVKNIGGIATWTGAVER